MTTLSPVRTKSMPPRAYKYYQFWIECWSFLWKKNFHCLPLSWAKTSSLPFWGVWLCLKMWPSWRQSSLGCRPLNTKVAVSSCQEYIASHVLSWWQERKKEFLNLRCLKNCYTFYLTSKRLYSYTRLFWPILWSCTESDRLRSILSNCQSWDWLFLQRSAAVNNWAM